MSNCSNEENVEEQPDREGNGRNGLASSASLASQTTRSDMSGNKTGRPRQDAAKRKSIQGREHLYSLYTSTPKPQALNSLPSSTAHPGFRRAEDKVVAHLDELYQDGGAVCTLRSILMKEAKRAGKGTWRQEDRKRAGRGESEGERESEDGGDEVSEAKVSKKRKRARRGELQLELPEMQRPEVDLPEGGWGSPLGCGVALLTICFAHRSTTRRELAFCPCSLTLPHC